MEGILYGKDVKAGITPAIALINPKFPHNVGAAVRAASCFGIKQVWFTGNRVSLHSQVGAKKKHRLPREERMRGYKEVELRQHDYLFDCFEGATPVAIELVRGAELLPSFDHPPNPIYVFGPEDSGISQVVKKLCHRFVAIPTRHCTNLSAAVYMVLYDRMVKRQRDGLDPVLPLEEALAEDRGWCNTEKIMREELEVPAHYDS